MSFEIEAMVRVWNASLGEQLHCSREPENPHDLYAVAVLKSGVVVCHLPRLQFALCF